MIAVAIAEIVIAIVSAGLTCKPVCGCCMPKGVQPIPYGTLPTGTSLISSLP